MNSEVFSCLVKHVPANRSNGQKILQASQGRQAQLNDLLSQYRDRLLRMVKLRLDNRVQGRVDASDVIQESYIEAAHRTKEYLDGSRPRVNLEFYEWPIGFLPGSCTARRDT